MSMFEKGKIYTIVANGSVREKSEVLEVEGNLIKIRRKYYGLTPGHDKFVEEIINVNQIDSAIEY